MPPAPIVLADEPVEVAPPAAPRLLPRKLHPLKPALRAPLRAPARPADAPKPGAAAGAGGPAPAAPPAAPPVFPVVVPKPPPAGDVPALEDGLDADDLCNACFTDPLSEAPSIKLPCGHGVHLHCMRQLLTVNAETPKLSFAFLICPLKCKAPLDHPLLNDLLAPLREQERIVKEKALQRLKFEELEDEAKAAGEDPGTFAMRTLTYYRCFKCSNPFFGGRAACGAGDGPEPRKEDLLCSTCAPYSAESNCEKHGTTYIDWKCRFCCSIALFHCFGTTHFCKPCHDKYSTAQKLERDGELPPCPAGPLGVKLPEGTPCPLGLPAAVHPPPGEERALGCSLCRSVAAAM